MLEYGVHLPLVDLGAGLSLRRLQDCAHAAVLSGIGTSVRTTTCSSAGRGSTA